jgi:hypothetical protein
MSGSWCMWCMSHPNNWKLHPVPEADRAKDKRKEGTDRCRSLKGAIINSWCQQSSHTVFSQLHVGIGLVNNVPHSFYLFIADQVEMPTEEEKCSCNSCIVADVSLTKGIERLDEWKNVFRDIAMKQVSCIN